MAKNEVQEKVKDVAKLGDSLIGDGIGLLSNKVAPVVGPIVISILWKHKVKILIVLLCMVCLSAFFLESLFVQSAAGSSIKALIPPDHAACITQASSSTGTQFELLASYGKVISNFDSSHKGSGIGFMEIPDDLWRQNEQGLKGASDICTNYLVLARILANIPGGVEQKIDNYPYSQNDEVKRWFQLFVGAALTPYGNPIGLERSDLVVKTSGYNLIRVIFGRKHVHKGVDVVPSGIWYGENPGKASTQAVNRAILAGQVSLFKDQYGALCAYITNQSYKLLYCHCDSFIAKQSQEVKYGDPICFMGSTGFSTAPHTHIALYEKNGDSWQMVDPTPFIFPAKSNGG